MYLTWCAKIDEYGILDSDVIHEFNQFLYQEKRSSRDKQKMTALLNKGCSRIREFDVKGQLEIKKFSGFSSNVYFPDSSYCLSK